MAQHERDARVAAEDYRGETQIRGAVRLTVCWIAGAALVLLLVGLDCRAAVPVSFTVNSTLDEVDDLTMPGMCHTASGTCTLRAAVMQANRSRDADATIVLPAGTYTLTIPQRGGPTDETGGDLNLVTPNAGNPAITIRGAGASATIIDANRIDRAIRVHVERTASISGVTIRNGYLAEPFSRGGGIYAEGPLTLTDAAVTDNQADSGAGIASFGKLVITNTLIARNRARVEGGGVWTAPNSTALTNTTVRQNSSGSFGAGIYNAGLLRVVSSTISENNAGKSGGGIANLYGGVVLINSTISLNNTNDSGGGVFSTGGIRVDAYNATIVFNGADADRDGGTGAGIYNDAGSVFSLTNSLVAGNNVGNTPIYDDCTGVILIRGRNLMGASPAPCTIVTDPRARELGRYDALSSQSLIGPLQDNGGPTPTHAVFSGSNAIDAAGPVEGCIDDRGAPLATDQRGAARGTGAACDIGAFELKAGFPAAITAEAIEYHHAGFDHYFVTAIADEITKLDNGTFAGWSRTGESFNVNGTAAGGLAEVCRFFSTSFAPKSSHFYTPDATECAAVKANANWQFEAVVFYMASPGAAGNCASGTRPIYRVYNNGQGDAPNHRYTRSVAVRSDMLAKGWVPEGYGPIGVIMCAPE